MTDAHGICLLNSHLKKEQAESFIDKIEADMKNET